MKRLSDHPVGWTQRLLTGVLMATIAKHCPSRLPETDTFTLFTESMTKVHKPALERPNVRSCSLPEMTVSPSRNLLVGRRPVC